MFTTSVSAVKSFWSSPWLWWVEYVHGRVLRYPPVALVTGIAWHEFMEELLTGTPRATAKDRLALKLQVLIDEAELEGLSARASGIKRERNVLLTAAELWQDRYDVETIAVEKALKLDLIDNNGEPFRLVGRQDRIIRFGNRIGHYQHRTLAGNKPLDQYIDVFHRNPHECSYWKMLEQEYNEQPFGTMLSVVRKLAPDKMLEAPDAALQTHVVNISPERAAEGLQNIINTVTVMRAVHDRKLNLWHNPDTDLGAFGNSLNPYVRAYMNHGLAGLDDDRWFVQATDRYAGEFTE